MQRMATRRTDGTTSIASYFNEESLLEGLVFGNGCHANQKEEIPQQRQMDNHWWPAILSCQIEDPWVLVRCDALINQFARPRQTHISRLRVFDKAGNVSPMISHCRFPPSPPPPPPATPPPFPTWLTETTVEIEELEEETLGPTAWSFFLETVFGGFHFAMLTY